MLNLENVLLNTLFENDGSLRDIYILNTNRYDWIQLWEFLNNSYDLVLSIDGEIASKIPKDVIDIFNLKKEKSIYLIIPLNGIEFNCHFFYFDEIEFNITPRSVNNILDVKTIIKFMGDLSFLLSKNVSISIENDKDDPWLTSKPNGKYTFDIKNY